MNKNFVIWKQNLCKDQTGKDFYLPLAERVDSGYRRTLLSRILAMPTKKPMSFEIAIYKLRLARRDAFQLGLVGNEREHYHWYMENFITWISEQGYHIVLTGDEFTHLETHRPA